MPQPAKASTLEELADRIIYSDRYSDDKFEYRHVILPKQMLKLIPKSYFSPDDTGLLRILEENEWRGIGITQSLGWEHFEVHGEQESRRAGEKERKGAREQDSKGAAEQWSRRRVDVYNHAGEGRCVVAAAEMRGQVKRGGRSLDRSGWDRRELRYLRARVGAAGKPAAKLGVSGARSRSWERKTRSGVEGHARASYL
ncbi:Cyclin-dependent kinases regulatory subunit (Cell division control protein cks1) [Saitozyma podzolica]|uniref:Cyclin-dependent kinases regulatory subunit n=1 Tax=Saitozyma podzolica TaxID=1890683 RepID=A0A427YV25_9TREE|nr:Cyclin-dependent kinases regulatory subunit (Cell division control protein cks1) [Saitozyma podzolica]